MTKSSSSRNLVDSVDNMDGKHILQLLQHSTSDTMFRKRHMFWYRDRPTVSILHSRSVQHFLLEQQILKIG